MTDLSSDKKPRDARILVISSDAALVGGLAADMEDAGIRLDHVGSAARAQERLGGSECSLILLDADDLDIDPAQYLRDLTRAHEGVPVIVTATEATRGLLLELFRTRILDFFAKPIDTARICSAIRSLLRTGPDEPTHVDSDAPVAATVPEDRNRSTLSGEFFRATQELQALNKTLKQHVSQLTILYQMGRDISENENWSDALDRFLMALVNYTHAEGAALLLFSDNATRLSVRSNFQVDPAILSQSCQVLVENWKQNPRGSEIHTIESYRDMVFNACLDRRTQWRFTIIPLRHRNRPLGFLFIDKTYRSGHSFRIDYHFFNTIQTILAEEVANASYISELRQLSRFNQKILDNIKSGVVTTDLDGYVRFYNQQALSMCSRLGRPSRVHFDSLFRSDSYGKAIYKNVVRSKKDTHVLDVTYCGQSDVDFPARLNITKMHDDNLNGTVLVAIFEDLSEQRQLEREVRRNDRLRVLGQVSAGVAHEIRNPLTGIATSVEVLGSKLHDDPDKTKYIRVILEEINRLNEIIRNLLNFARPTKPRMSSFTLTELSQRVVNLLHDEAREKGIRLEVRDELEKEACRADLNQLTQVLLNIVLNSIQACGRGDSVTMLLRNEESAEQGGHGFATIDVIDNGVGVPQEIRDSLFEPFVTTKTHGTGLGLAISQQIVEEHQGHISCEFLKKGTCFSIKLPM